MTKIVIGLAAVVILIVVVVLLAMRYLRADDGDPFKDFDEGPDRRDRGPDDRDRTARDRRSRRTAPARVAAAEPPRAAGRYPAGTDRAPGREGGTPAASARGDARTRGAAADEWPTTAWDSLSDIDYWAEVASDKPLTTTARPAGQASGAQPGDRRRTADQRPGRRGAAAGRPGRRPRGRSKRGPVPTAAPPRQVDYLPAPDRHARPDPSGPSAAADQRAVAGQARTASVSGAPGGARRADDDPLTSPSFPRISAADSRSYHGGRDAGHGGHGDAAEQPATQPGERRAPSPGTGGPGGYREPSSQRPGGSLDRGPWDGGYLDSGVLDRGCFDRSALNGGYLDRRPPAGNSPDRALLDTSLAGPDSSLPDDRTDRSSLPTSPGFYGGYATPSLLDVPAGERVTGYGGVRTPRHASAGHVAAGPGPGGWYPEWPRGSGSYQGSAGPGVSGGGPVGHRGGGQPAGSGFLRGGHPYGDGGNRPAGYPLPGYPPAWPYDGRPDPADPYGHRGYGSVSR